LNRDKFKTQIILRWALACPGVGKPTPKTEKRDGESTACGCRRQRETTALHFPCTIIMMLFNTKLNSGVSPPFGSPGGTVLNNFVKRNTEMKIATWNVRSMYEMVETERVVREMERLRIDILGVSEMRWKGNGKFGMPAHTIYYAGNNEPIHYKGVGFIVARKVNDAVRNFVPQSDRVALLQLSGKGVNINIVQVYAPTSNSDEEELEVFYESVSEVLKMTKREDVNIVMGDFNAKVGAGPQGDVVGAWGLGVRNNRGERMIQFCQEENLIVANTYFQLPARRLYT